MKTYNFIIFQNGKDVADIEVNAKTEQEAKDNIQKEYPAYKGYTYELIKL